MSPCKMSLLGMADRSWFTVRAETIAEFILERAGPVIFKTFFVGKKKLSDWFQ